MLLIYAEYITARLEYVVNLFFSELYTIPYQITNEAERYVEYSGPKINYSNSPLVVNDCLWAPHGLLFENSVQPIDGVFAEVAENGVFFPVYNNDSVQRFDPFAAAFYMVSRYEEYLPFIPDSYGRFEAAESILYKTGNLLTPLVNVWAAQVIDIISRKWPVIQIKKPAFEATITIDIDQAYEVWLKEKWRVASRMIKNAFRGRFKENAAIFKTMRGVAPDAFDSYRYISETMAGSNLTLVYFINLGKYSKFDKNIRRKKLTRLIKSLATNAEIGIHPSYYSSEQPKLLSAEIGKLRSMTDKPVTKSRQHYLRLSFPETYRQLIANGIKEDYSMAYASYPGFRAGTCSEFNWFDLEKNTCTDLRIKPATWMEGTFAEDLSLSPDESWKMMKKLLHTVYAYNGHFIPIWHNHTIAETGLYKGWRNLFEKMLNEIECIPYEKKESYCFSHQ